MQSNEIKERKTRDDKIELTDDQIEMLAKYAALGLTMEECAALIGISRATLFRRMSEDERLSETLLKVRAQLDAQVIQSLWRNAVKKNNVTSQIFWLKTRRGWTDNSYDDGSDEEYTLPKSMEKDDSK